MSSMQSRIEFTHVNKKYALGLTRTSLPSVLSTAIKQRIKGGARSDAQTHWALRDVSFDLEPGKSMALVGRNGAGKTTILKLLANITKPTSGRVTVRGQLSALIELGAGFHPDLTGRENIYLNGTILGLGRKEIARSMDEIIAFSELERFIETPVKRYSSGMVVRLGFAVASCIAPDVLLVDEVLAVGDARFQEKCLKRIQTLLQNGTSIIFVSHNLYLVRVVCESALYLEQGQVKALGATADVIARYEQALHEERALKFGMEAPEQPRERADLEITKVEVVGIGAGGIEALHSDLPAQVRIHYVAHRSMGTVSVATHLTRSDGLSCAMLRTSIDRVQVVLERGEGVVAITLNPLQLITGTYFAESHFLNETDSLVIVSSRSDWFYVQGAGLSYEERSGVFKPRAHWEHWRNGSQPRANGAQEFVALPTFVPSKSEVH